jgi:hypothetical protein
MMWSMVFASCPQMAQVGSSSSSLRRMFLKSVWFRAVELRCLLFIGCVLSNALASLRLLS